MEQTNEGNKAALILFILLVDFASGRISGKGSSVRFMEDGPNCEQLWPEEFTVDVDSLNSIPVHISPRKQQIRTRRRTPKSDSNREKSKEQRYWKELNGMIEKLDDKDTEHIAMHYLKYDY